MPDELDNPDGKLRGTQHGYASHWHPTWCLYLYPALNGEEEL
jgi:hypothetical protein